jgi:hypothetical protein
MMMRRRLRAVLATAMIAVVAAGCGGGTPSAIARYAAVRWPDGKVLHCEKTGQVAEAGKVWQCAVRRHNATGQFAKDTNAVIDAAHPPLIVCLAIRDGGAFEVEC